MCRGSQPRIMVLADNDGHLPLCGGAPDSRPLALLGALLEGREQKAGESQPHAETPPRLVPSVASPQGLVKYFLFPEPCSGHHPKRAWALEFFVLSSLVTLRSKRNCRRQQPGDHTHDLHTSFLQGGFAGAEILQFPGPAPQPFTP